jgi:hypothetical protein
MDTTMTRGHTIESISFSKNLSIIEFVFQNTFRNSVTDKATTQGKLKYPPSEHLLRLRLYY